MFDASVISFVSTLGLFLGLVYDCQYLMGLTSFLQK